MTKGHGKTNVVDIGVDNPYADPNVQHVGISLLGDTFEFGGAKDNGNKNGTRFGEWGQPPGYAGIDKAKGNASNVDSSWRNFLTGKGGQFSAGHMPPMSSLFDFISRNPGMITPDMMSKIASILPMNGARAMANGGMLTEEVRGIGMVSGKPYLLGESGAEMILPVRPGAGDALSLSNVAQQIAEGVIKGAHVAGRSLADGTDQGGHNIVSASAPTNPITRVADTGGKPGMLGKVNEHVSPYPGSEHPGWFVGDSGKVYKPDGSVVPDDQLRASIPNAVTNAIASGIRPGGVNAGGGGNSSGATAPPAGTPGGVQLVQINITDTIQMPDGKTIVRTITSDPVAVTDLGSAVFHDAAQHQPSPTGRTPS